MKSSESANLKGKRKPRIRVCPEYKNTYGHDAATLSAAYGMKPDPWQEDVLCDWLAVDEYDEYVSKTAAISCPRQNGKNGILEARELYGITVLGEKILHTAHEVRTQNAAFKRLCSFFENSADYPELVEMVEYIRRANGQEAVVLKNGGSVQFSARSKNAARGFTVDVVVCDEAQELSDDELDALLPTKSAAPLGNPQLILLGTPPGPLATGDVFSRTRKNALAKEPEEGLAWIEWSVDKIGDIKNKRRWAQANPSLGTRLLVKAIEGEIASMSPDGFARERLGWWVSSNGKAIIDESIWKKLYRKKSPEPEKLAYGIKFSPDGASVSLAVAAKAANEPVHVEVISHKSMSGGISWLCDWLIERKDKAAVIVIDGRANSDEFVSRLREGRVPVKAIQIAGTPGAIASSSRFLNAVREEKISHFNQPSLNRAALNAEKRRIGAEGGWGWKGIDGEDVTPLEAVSLAYWGVMTTKRNPNRRMRIG